MVKHSSENYRLQHFSKFIAEEFGKKVTAMVANSLNTLKKKWKMGLQE